MWRRSRLRNYATNILQGVSIQRANGQLEYNGHKCAQHSPLPSIGIQPRIEQLKHSGVHEVGQHAGGNAGTQPGSGRLEHGMQTCLKMRQRSNNQVSTYRGREFVKRFLEPVVVNQTTPSWHGVTVVKLQHMSCKASALDQLVDSWDTAAVTSLHSKLTS